MKAYVELLRAGLIVACPTETLMGLLADASNERAVQRVLELKGRPANEPLPLIVPSLEVAMRFVRDLPAIAVELATRYWPGPLTLVLHAQAHVPAPLVKDGKVAVRVPGPSPALDLVTAFGGPLTATSANPSGKSPLSTEAELRAAFGGGLAAVVSGKVPGGRPSTIVDVSSGQPVVLRQGAIALHA
ncbi:MAG: L-threonylcarbamoyladenylate synthase [Polyangiales bacterium]